MASVEKVAVRRQLAINRINSLKEFFRTNFNIEFSEKSKIKTDDKALLLVIELEDFADTMEKVKEISGST